MEVATKVDDLPTSMYSCICATRAINHRLFTGNTGDCTFQGPLYRLSMTYGLTLKAVKIGAVILNTTRNIHMLTSTSSCEPRIHLYQGNLRHIGSIALTFTQLGNARIAAWTTNIARSQFFEHLFNYQFIWQRTEDLAASMQLDNH